MRHTPEKLAELALTFIQENAAQIAAKSAQNRMPPEDGSQDVIVVFFEKYPKFDPTKGTLPQFIFGHWGKRLRRQRGAHSFAFSLDREDHLGEGARARVENMVAPSDCDTEEVPFLSDQTVEAKMLAIARLVSGMSTSDIAQRFGVTPRRARQMLQQVREKRTIPRQFEFCVKGLGQRSSGGNAMRS